MSPEEWLATQPKQSSTQPLILSPEEWLAKQQPQQQAVKSLSPEEWLAQQNKTQALTPETESFSTLRGVADVPLQVSKGLVSGVRMVSDAFGANSDTSKTLKGAEDYLANLMSAQSKQDSQEVARIMKEAEDKGVLDQVKAGVKAFMVAPIDLLSNAFGTAAPAIVASLGASVLGPAAVIGAGITVGSTMGAGVVKGSIYDAVKEELSKIMPADQAEARAQLAQEYNGKNLDMILTGAAIGILGTTTGAEPAIARQLAKGILTKAAVKQELSNVAEEGLKKTAQRGVVKQGAITGGTEFATEFGQAGQEQLAQNIAAQREGVDVPTMRGVVGQATLEGLAGLGLGAVAGGREALKAQDVLDQRRIIADEKIQLKEEQLKKEKANTLEGKAAAQQNIDDILAASLNALKEDTFDILSNEEKAARVVELEESIATRQAKLDAGMHDNPKAAVITQAKENKELVALKTSLSKSPTETVVKQTPAEYMAELETNKLKGDQDVIQPIDAGTSGVGAGIPRGPDTTGATPGATEAGLGRAGMDGNQGLKSTPQDGEGAQQSALDQEVIDQQALADQEAKAAAAAEATRLTEEQRLTVKQEALQRSNAPIVEEFTSELDEEITALNEEAAAKLAGKVIPPKEVKPPKEPKAAATQGKKTKAVKAAPVTADYLNSETFYGDASPITIVNERKANKDNKLDTDPINVGIMNAGHEIAFDAFDTVDVRNGVNPELKAIAEEKNKTQRAKRQQMRKELSGKKDPETDKPYSNKRLTSLVSNIPLYKAGAPLEFLTKKELAAIYKKYVGKRKFVKEEKTTREAQKQNRDKFVKELNELQKIKLKLVEQRAFTEEAAANTLRKTQTTGADSRKDRVSKTSEELSKELQAITKEDASARETAAQQVAKQETVEAAEEKATLEAPLKKEAEVKKPPKKKPTPTKSKLVSKIESAIVNDDLTLSKDSVLDTIKDRELNDRITGTIADQFLKILSDFLIQTKIKFGKLEINEDGKFDPKTNTITVKGTNKDGYTGTRPLAETVMHEVSHATLDHVFDNETKFIKYLEDQAAKDSARRAELNKKIKALEAKIKKLKTDKKNEETVAAAVAELRELRAEFNKPILVVRDVRSALNRLKQNHKVVLARFGKKYNIASLKEFAAEFLSNSAFQQDLALMASPTPYTSKENFFTTIVKNIAAALGISSPNEASTFKEIAEDLAQLISIPSRGIRGKEVSYSTAMPRNPKQAPFLKVESVYDSNPAFGTPEKLQKKTFISVIKNIFTHQSIQNLISDYQNDRQAVKFIENQNIRAGTNKDYGPDVNNTYTQISLAPVKGMIKYFNQIFIKENKLIQKITSFAETKEVIEAAKRANETETEKEKITPIEMARRILHMYGQAFTDVERRLNMFVQTSPLENTAKVVPVGSKMITVADFRNLLLGKNGIFNTNQNLTEDQARQLWERLESYVFVTDANGNKTPNPKYVVPDGYSSEGRTALDFRNIEGSTAYNVTGFTYDETNKILKEYETDPNKDTLDEIFNISWDLNKVALELNKEFYYVSKPAANWIAAYGYQNYLPLKGITNHTDAQQRSAYEFNGGKEKDLAETAIKTEGRFSVSNNPILQTMSEAMIASMRAGKGPEYTLSIKNLLGKGINGQVVGTVPFNEKSFDTIKNFRKENTIFHHNEDGSIDVLEINDNKMLNSIRRTFKDSNKFIEMANLITSGLGQSHTRYNYNFAPVNFVRDALTNAWNIGATLGPVKGAELITRMAIQVATKNSLGKAFMVARAYKTPNFEKYKNNTDPIIKNMYELLSEGGMTEFIEGISLKSNLDKLNKEAGRSKIIKTKEGLDKIIDVWTNMFEIASRAAAYGVLKDHYMNVMKLDEKAAKIRAASTTLNLANFSQVGEYGKVMGALYMFYRPSATGAVRAIESITPMIYGSLERAEKNMPEHIKNDPAAKATYMDNYKKERHNAQLMTTILAGAGALAYTMSYMMSDTDDEDRNKVLTDDMSQWTRFWRIHIPGFDKPFQIPWGFGLGAFAAMGAQLAAVLSGQQSFGSALKNGVTQIALDSFVPVPVSRMDITDEPAAWFVDSLAPSFIRPVVEFVANKNGLGQSIYNDATGRKMGDAYLGGDHVPETYKIFTAWLAESTDGYLDWTPNSAYFLVNSYADGPARIIDLMVNNYYLANGTKEFNAKTDVPFIGSFIGAAPNIDTREFTKVEKQINELRQVVNGFKENRPDFYYFKYLPEHPFDESIVKLYDKSISDLNELRAQNKIYRGGDFTLKERKELLDMNRMQQNFIKHNLVEMFKAYDIKP